MLVSFEGKGCANCPFYYENDRGEWHECWLNGKAGDGGVIRINDGKNLLIGETPTEWPKGCPFGEHVGTLQVTALEGTC